MRTQTRKRRRGGRAAGCFASSLPVVARSGDLNTGTVLGFGRPRVPVLVEEPWTGWPSCPEPEHGGGSGVSRILVPFNGTDPARSAVDFVATLSADRPTVVWVLYVRMWDVAPAGGRFCLETMAEARGCAQAAVAQLQRQRVSTRAVVRDARRERVPWTIVSVAEALEVGCIVLGSHPRPVWASALWGSTSRSVVRRATRPVVLVYAPKRERGTWACWRSVGPQEGGPAGQSS
jgi:nucleotide-binding universal stress UspA family protein